jgi:hypothetical protein
MRKIAQHVMRPAKADFCDTADIWNTADIWDTVVQEPSQCRRLCPPGRVAGGVLLTIRLLIDQGDALVIDAVNLLQNVIG